MSSSGTESGEREELVGRTVEWGDEKNRKGKSLEETTIGTAAVGSASASATGALTPSAAAAMSTSDCAQDTAASSQLDQVSSQLPGQQNCNPRNPGLDPLFTLNFPSTSTTSASASATAAPITQAPSGLHSMPMGLSQPLMLPRMPQQAIPSSSQAQLLSPSPQQPQQNPPAPAMSQMLLQHLATAGNQGGVQQPPLLAAYLQQQLAQLRDPDTSNAATQALMDVLPQLSSTPHIQQQVAQTLLQHQAEQQRRQQELEQQQRQQQQQQQQQQDQMVSLMGVLLQQRQQEQHPESNPLLQVGVLQQLLASQATSTLPPLQGNALLELLAQQQQQQQGIAPRTDASAPITQAPPSAASNNVNASSLLEVLASASNQVARMPSAAYGVNPMSTQIQGLVTRKAAGSLDLSDGRSIGGNLKDDLTSASTKKQRRINPTFPRPPSTIGRPPNAFVNRDANGRASSLPTLLVMPADLVELSPHQTLLRYQIEVFRAGEEDVATHTRGRNKPVELHQIGLRCRHCKTLPVAERLRGSVYFPRAVEGFYQAAQNMNSTHLQTGECQLMGDALRQEFTELITSRGTSTGAGRAYWALQARNLGLSNTEDGIRFHNSQDTTTTSSGAINSK